MLTDCSEMLSRNVHCKDLLLYVRESCATEACSAKSLEVCALCSGLCFLWLSLSPGVHMAKDVLSGALRSVACVCTQSHARCIPLAMRCTFRLAVPSFDACGQHALACFVLLEGAFEFRNEAACAGDGALPGRTDPCLGRTSQLVQLRLL